MSSLDPRILLPLARLCVCVTTPTDAVALPRHRGYNHAAMWHGRHGILAEPDALLSKGSVESTRMSVFSFVRVFSCTPWRNGHQQYLVDFFNPFVLCSWKANTEDRLSREDWVCCLPAGYSQSQPVCEGNRQWLQECSWDRRWRPQPHPISKTLAMPYLFQSAQWAGAHTDRDPGRSTTRECRRRSAPASLVHFQNTAQKR